MKLIPLTKGYSANVDDADYEALSQHKWHAAVDSKTVYAARKTPEQANALMESYHKNFPTVRQWVERIRKESHARSKKPRQSRFEW